jgi:hypothetical protein
MACSGSVVHRILGLPGFLLPVGGYLFYPIFLRFIFTFSCVRLGITRISNWKFVRIFSSPVWVLHVQPILSSLRLKMAVFWVVAPCSLVEAEQRFKGTCCLHHQGYDGGSKDLWNVGKLLPDYTALQPRRQPSSYSPPWEPQNHPWVCFSYMACVTKLLTIINVIKYWSAAWETDSRTAGKDIPFLLRTRKLINLFTRACSYPEPYESSSQTHILFL